MMTLTEVTYQMERGEVSIVAYDHHYDEGIFITLEREDTETLLKSLVGFEAEFQRSIGGAVHENSDSGGFKEKNKED